MERNFAKLEIGSWYLNRSGAIVQIVDVRSGQFPYMSSQGKYFDSAGISSKTSQKLDLITELEPLVIRAKKKKVKKTIRRYCNIYPTYPSQCKDEFGNPFAFMYDTKEAAIKFAQVGCVKAGFEILVEYEMEE